MNEEHSKESVAIFRKMPEVDAYSWILDSFPPSTEDNARNAIFFLSKRSWSRKIQVDSLAQYMPLINGVFFKYAIDNLAKVFNYEILEKAILHSVRENKKNRHFAEYYLYGKSSVFEER